MKSCRILARWLFLAGLSLSLFSGALARAAEYSLYDLGSLGNGHQAMWASGINASGQVVGYSYAWGSDGHSSTVEYQAFVSGVNGVGLRPLGTLGGSWSRGLAINDAGQVTGDAQTASGSTHAFLGGAAGRPLNDLGTLGGLRHSSGTAINASGQVAGIASSGDLMVPVNPDAVQGFISGPNGAALRPLGQAIFPRDINSSGQVVGNVAWSTAFITGPDGSALTLLTTGEEHSMNAINDQGVSGGGWRKPYLDGVAAFVRDADGVGTALDFTGVPGYLPGRSGGSGQYGPATTSWVLAMNEHGQLGGRFVDTTYGIYRAFITGPDGADVVNVDTLFTLPDEHFRFESVTGINDAGQFIVNANNGHAYLITPVPEPAVLLMMFSGLALFGMARRGRWTSIGTSGRTTDAGACLASV